MRRYWIPKNQIQDQQVILEGEVFHHIVDVCRQEVGSKFEVLNEGDQNSGVAYFVEIIEVQKKKAVAQVLETRKIESLRKPYIHLCVSVPRFPVFEAVIEKSVEMGVLEIQPLFSDFSFVKSESMISDSKWSRWQKIVISATQQSGRGDLMKLQPAQKMENFITKINQDQSSLCLICYEGQTTFSVKNYLKNKLSERPSQAIENVYLFVGSEGGFSQKEVDFFKSLDFQPVTLGPQILRVETACMTLVSVLKYEFDLMR